MDSALIFFSGRYFYLAVMLTGVAGMTLARTDGSASNQVHGSDRAFAVKAARGGKAEVEMGKLAADMATKPEVKEFGKQMADDHTKANEDLNSAAGKVGLDLPKEMSSKQTAEYEKLKRLTGDAFDREYVRMMATDHAQDVNEFEKEIRSGKNDQIKGFASRTLPVIQGHLDKIKTIQAEMLPKKGSK